MFLHLAMVDKLSSNILSNLAEIATVRTGCNEAHGDWRIQEQSLISNTQKTSITTTLK